MRKQFLAGFGAFVFTLFAIASHAAVPVYQNTFDTPAALNGFTIYQSTFIGYNPPPLSTVSIDSGQLKIVNTHFEPNGPGTNPTLTGRSTMILGTSSFGPGYNSILAQNAGEISWTFNVSNLDSAEGYNNGFSVILSSTKSDSYDLSADGYVFRGGGLVGSSMSLRRFDFGMGGGGEELIVITTGLGTLPQLGSFKITYNPANHLWSVFGNVGPSYQDPTTVQTLLGSAVDSTYTSLTSPFMGLEGFNVGTDYFDNFTVSIVPEPSSLAIVCCAAVVLVQRSRSRSIASRS